MNNKYEGKCYVCGEVVPPGKGNFEKDWGTWVVRHITCKGTPPREKARIEKLKVANH